MKVCADILEDMQIAEVIKERVTERKEPAKMISHEEMKKFLRGKSFKQSSKVTLLAD